MNSLEETHDEAERLLGETIAIKHMKVVDAEYDINPDKTIYLITWSPDPEDIGFPDADFETQHRYHVNLLSDYLKACSIGLFCVESSQQGRPHYHGWYQLRSDTEMLRINLIKVMQRFGLVKITKSKGHYKLGSYSNKANCLYYYKKDMIDSMIMIKQNPINKLDKDDTDWSSHMLIFTKTKRQTIADLEKAISLKEFYTQFYNNSLE